MKSREAFARSRSSGFANEAGSEDPMALGHRSHFGNIPEGVTCYHSW